MSHVPRACYNSKNPPVDNLENYIVERSKSYGFALERLVRPKDCGASVKPELYPDDALNKMPLQEMQEMGAAMFIFRRTKE